MNAELTAADVGNHAENITDLLADEDEYETHVTVEYKNVHGNMTTFSGVVTTVSSWYVTIDTLEEQDDGTPILRKVYNNGRVESITGQTDRRISHKWADYCHVTIEDEDEDDEGREVCTDGGVTIEDGGHEAGPDATIETTSVWTTAASVTEGATVTVRYESIKGSGSKSVTGEVTDVLARPEDAYGNDSGTDECRVTFEREDDGHRMYLKQDGLLYTTGSHYPKVGRLESVVVERGLPEPARPEAALREVAEDRADDDGFEGRQACREAPVEGDSILQWFNPEAYLDDDAHEVSQTVAWASDLMFAFDTALAMSEDRAKADADDDEHADPEPSLEDREDADETTAGYPVSVELTNGAAAWTENGRFVGFGALDEGDRVAVVLASQGDYHPEAVHGTVTIESSAHVRLETPAGVAYDLLKAGEDVGLTTEREPTDGGVGLTIEHGEVAHLVRLGQ